MPIYTTPIFNINLKKLIENYEILKKLSAPAHPAGVIKDDAYGLGAVEITKALYSAGCRHFFVAHGSEGAKVRPFAPEAQIFVLQGIGEDSFSYFKEANLIPVICSADMLAFWHKNKIKNINPAIQVETGLNRLGFTIKDLERLSADELNEFSYVLSHLSCADEQAHFMNERQLNNFRFIKERFFKNTPATLSASDGVFLGSDFHFDLTRLGAALYGINTAPYRENEMHNILELKAPVLQVKDLKKGEFVGYSATFRAPLDMKIAIVSVGYGDGLPRSLSNRGKVIFYENNEAHFCPILGRVSMDNIICDVSAIKELHSGDWGFLINDDYTIDDIARDAGTIAYELISNIGKNKRFIRSYQK